MKNIYHGKKHRTVYKKHFGPIPKDKFGRPMEIHHIDGNHQNNDISNLKLVTIEEHFRIHFSQGDYGACLIMSKRMQISSEEKSKLARENVKRMKEKGHLVFTDSEWQRQNQLRRVKDGTHHLLKRPDGTSHASDKVANGTHPFLGGNIQSKWQKKLLEDGRHISQTKIPCKHCGRIFNKGNYLNWHGDRCKLKT